MAQDIGSDEMTFLELTNRLRDLGYYDGPPEERPCPATTAALEKFQRDHGLPVTRLPYAATTDALRTAYCY